MAGVKILATFDGSPLSEATLDVLGRLAKLPGAELTLLAVAHEPGARMKETYPRRVAMAGADYTAPVALRTSAPRYAETKSQALQRRRAELETYLHGLAARLPKKTKVRIEAHIANKPAKTIIKAAKEDRADVIVMATRSRKGLARAVIGSTTDEVIRSGVAPVLAVHPLRKA
jgi:nucleotide-binding universal stress UspA family protein